MAACGLMVLAARGMADDPKTRDKAGDLGGGALLVAGIGSSFVQDGRQGLRHAEITLGALAFDAGFTEGLKALTREKRPDASGHDSFPSLHASLTFAVAAAESYYHPSQAPFWFGGAALVSYSRIPAHKHYWQDVVAGAVLGYGCGQLSVSNPRGWLFGPSLNHGHSAGVGMSFGTYF
jgi:membrane-associated phospholipid phosphatase